ncbi:probable UPC2 Regulatory protein involved in control of sterol uptake [Cephalotrichum gorgonifer]|uniref:Probable UPC2 Regulatory protein involved in control of sterol uptake n=1 Tax=Cephalotrichum gorgonifer TaxID=2041049 RepID=A0AAE8MSB3_9PEZI|nr:probable UPC2 Regulatory protein involved in control of sterol uptake [Cephalotrichum gorgonifer]
MVGPGGGPPRRSHTKSRKGCETCKKRHIRCDESFPQCRNCTKHKIRCPYNEMPVPDDRGMSPDKPDLMWTPQIEAEIVQWQRTGIFPFPNLNIYPAPSPQAHTFEELRLIHHVASICSELGNLDANGFTIWTRQMPTILQIGATNAYVMQSLLAFSAMHIAYLTDCPMVGNMAYEHRGIALKGLQEAISSFSRDTSDAVLAASLVLSWQATDWRSWTHLMQGTSSVIGAMDPWKHESKFGDFIAESSTFPTAPPSPTPDHKPHQPSQVDLDVFQETLQQLVKVEVYLKQNKQDTKPIQQLIVFLKGSRKVSPTLSVTQQFERLRPLRTWLFWLPVKALQESGGSANSLLTIAHYYTAALVMERLFPEIGAAYFGSLTLKPVEEIGRQLYTMSNAASGASGVQTPLALMEFPIQTVSEFRSRMGWMSPVRTPSYPQFSPPDFYVSGSPVPLPPVSGPYMPYGSPSFSYSNESLPVLGAETAASSTAASPLMLTSSFNTSSQFLTIPSPAFTNSGLSPASSYTASAISPASSTFEGSFTYSDNEDYGPYDWTGMPSSESVLGGASGSSYGVGITPATPGHSTGDATASYRPSFSSASSFALSDSTTGAVTELLQPPPIDDNHHHQRTPSGGSGFDQAQ